MGTDKSRKLDCYSVLISKFVSAQQSTIIIQKKYPSLDSDYVISSDLLKLQFASVVIGVMNSFPFRNAQKYSVTNQGLHLEFLLKTIIFQGKCVLI